MRRSYVDKFGRVVIIKRVPMSRRRFRSSRSGELLNFVAGLKRKRR
jgi:hypothetical protein